MKPPFYETLSDELIRRKLKSPAQVVSQTVGRQADGDGYFRSAWREFIVKNPTDPLGLLVSPLLDWDWERRTTPLPPPDPKFRWKW